MFELSEKQIMIRDMVRKFTEQEIQPLDKIMDENGFEPELYRKMAEVGIMGLTVPKEYGGSECDSLTSAIVINEIAKGSGSVALNMDAQIMVTEMLVEHGSETQKAKYLPMGVSGKLFAFALTEPNGGTDAAGLKTRADYDEKNEEWVINGSKAWITNAHQASIMILMAKTDISAGTNGISAFIIPMDTPGISLGKHEDKLGMRGSVTSEVFLDDVRLPKDAILGKPGMGFKYAMQCLDGARIIVGSISLGLAEHAFMLAREYAGQREAFGKAIGKFQGISFKLADMATQLYAAKLMVYNTARMKDAGKPFSIEAAETKLFCSEMSHRICNDCIQIYGAFGYSREYDVERLWRDNRILEIGEGTSEIIRNLVGSKMVIYK